MLTSPGLTLIIALAVYGTDHSPLERLTEHHEARGLFAAAAGPCLAENRESGTTGRGSEGGSYSKEGLGYGDQSVRGDDGDPSAGRDRSAGDDRSASGRWAGTRRAAPSPGLEAPGGPGVTGGQTGLDARGEDVTTGGGDYGGENPAGSR